MTSVRLQRNDCAIKLVKFISKKTDEMTKEKDLHRFFYYMHHAKMQRNRRVPQPLGYTTRREGGKGTGHQNPETCSNKEPPSTTKFLV